MTKVIRIEDSGFVWHVPLEAVAKHRAAYYAERDSDTTFQEEVDYVMGDDYEGMDWFGNNMNWEDVAKDAVLVNTPSPRTEPRLNTEHCDCEVVEV